jgi:hypothetical protein
MHQVAGQEHLHLLHEQLEDPRRRMPTEVGLMELGRPPTHTHSGFATPPEPAL